METRCDGLNRMAKKLWTKVLYIGSKGDSKMLNRRMLLSLAIFATLSLLGIIDRTLTLGAFKNDDEQHYKNDK